MSGGQRTIVIAVIAALALIAPWVAYPVFLMTALCFALFACAFNLLLGYAGLMSFGHAMFFGMAGYFYGNVVKVWDLPPELGLVAGVLGAAALGVVTGALAIRRQGIYFAMITLAFAQMVYFFCVQAPFTGGEDGLQGIPRKALLGGLIPTTDDRVLYYVVLAIFLFGFGAIYRFIHSPFGQILKAIRDNEQRALSLGYEADRYKLLAFVLSAALAGLAGATKAMVMQFATLTDVSAAMSGEVVLMALVGGLGTIVGPVVGAFIIVTMQNYLAAFGEYVLVIQGAIFVVIVMAFRKGLVGELSEWWKSRSAARAEPRTEPGTQPGD
jgi:branched-chain amino acid transport system permease protein